MYKVCVALDNSAPILDTNYKLLTGAVLRVERNRPFPPVPPLLPLLLLLPPPPQPPQPPLPEQLPYLTPSCYDAGFDSSDVDSDGQISLAELQHWAQASGLPSYLAATKGDDVLARYDTNNDGGISPNEWPQIPITLQLSSAVNPGLCNSMTGYCPTIITSQQCIRNGCRSDRPTYICDEGLHIFYQRPSTWYISTLSDPSDRGFTSVVYTRDNAASPPRGGWRTSSGGRVTALTVVDVAATSPPPAPLDGCTCPKAYPTCAPDLRRTMASVGSATCVCRGCRSYSPTLSGTRIESGGSSSNACGCQNCFEEDRRFVPCGSSYTAPSSLNSAQAVGFNASIIVLATLGTVLAAAAGVLVYVRQRQAKMARLNRPPGASVSQHQLACIVQPSAISQPQLACIIQPSAV
jgi:hypothetical protein